MSETKKGSRACRIASPELWNRFSIVWLIGDIGAIEVIK